MGVVLFELGWGEISAVAAEAPLSTAKRRQCGGSGRSCSLAASDT